MYIRIYGCVDMNEQPTSVFGSGRPYKWPLSNGPAPAFDTLEVLLPPPGLRQRHVARRLPPGVQRPWRSRPYSRPCWQRAVWPPAWQVVPGGNPARWPWTPKPRSARRRLATLWLWSRNQRIRKWWKMWCKHWQLLPRCECFTLKSYEFLGSCRPMHGRKCHQIW